MEALVIIVAVAASFIAGVNLGVDIGMRIGR
jgi:hypothetical protein